MPSSSPDNDVFDPASRRLCPDGECVGVIDDAGRCPVCGKRGAPAPEGSQAAASVHLTNEVTDEVEAGNEPSEAGSDAGSDADASGNFDSKRRLCPDGACIGLLGPSGVCDVCGRAAS